MNHRQMIADHTRRQIRESGVIVTTETIVEQVFNACDELGYQIVKLDPGSRLQKVVAVKPTEERGETLRKTKEPTA